MKTFDLKGTKRNDLGSKYAKQLRREGKVPCVVYGNVEHIDFAVSAKELNGAVITPDVFIINLDIDGKIYPSVIKDLQFHPVTDEVLHADFYAFADDKPIVVKLPVQLEGHAPGVKAGGKMQINARKLSVKGLAKDMPDTVIVNVDNLELGQSIKVGEVKVENMELADSKDMLVCRVRTTRAAVSAAAAAAKK